jgi:hypothetical protein
MPFLILSLAIFKSHHQVLCRRSSPLADDPWRLRPKAVVKAVEPMDPQGYALPKPSDAERSLSDARR